MKSVSRGFRHRILAQSKPEKWIALFRAHLGLQIFVVHAKKNFSVDHLIKKEKLTKTHEETKTFILHCVTNTFGLFTSWVEQYV